jgi:hypothetical protein
MVQGRLLPLHRRVPECVPLVANSGSLIYITDCNCLVSRFSSAVEQRFCKPLVGSSILSTGTTSPISRHQQESIAILKARYINGLYLIDVLKAQPNPSEGI